MKRDGCAVNESDGAIIVASGSGVKWHIVGGCLVTDAQTRYNHAPPAFAWQVETDSCPLTRIDAVTASISLIWYRSSRTHPSSGVRTAVAKRSTKSCIRRRSSSKARAGISPIPKAPARRLRRASRPRRKSPPRSPNPNPRRLPKSQGQSKRTPHARTPAPTTPGFAFQTRVTCAGYS